MIKINILIHAINGIGFGHIRRTLIIAKRLAKLDMVGKIIFVSNSSNPFLIKDEGFKCFKLDYGIEDTLNGLDYEVYEKDSLLKINKIINENNIELLLHDTFFIKSLILQRKDLKHFLILRDSDLAYLKNIKPFLSLFKKVFIPHIKEELSYDKISFCSDFDNIIFSGYITGINRLKIQKKKKYIIVSPGYGGDYENTKKFFFYVNELLYKAYNYIWDYKIEFILGKYYDLLKEEIDFFKGFGLIRFKKDLSKDLKETDIFIGRGGYNSLNEVILTKTKSLIFAEKTSFESQYNRIKFFIEKLGVNYLKHGVYNIQKDKSNLMMLLSGDFYFSLLKSNYFNGSSILVNSINKELSKKDILVFKHIFLPKSENFIFEELYLFKNINPMILSLKRDNLESFKNNFEIFYNSKFNELLNDNYPEIKNKDLYIDFLKYIIYIIKKRNIKIIYTEFLFDAYFLYNIKKLHKDIKIFSAGRGFDVYTFLNNKKINKKTFFDNIDGIFVRDKNMKKNLVDYGFDSSKIEIIRSVLNFKEYNFYKKDFSKLKLLFGARCVEKKNLLNLVDLIKLLSDNNLLQKIGFVGDGPLYNDILEKIFAYGLKEKVNIYGFLNHKDLLKVIDNYNCFINYSKVADNLDDEGIPNMLLENILSGNLVFSTITGGIGEIIKDYKTGLVLSGDIKSDYKKIKAFISENKFDCITKRAFEKIKNVFGYKYSIKKLENILNENDK